MAQREFNITIAPDGTVEMHARGFKGRNCAEAVKLFEQIVGEIKAEQKTKGRPIPGTDAQIAAVARLYNLTVLSADHHFQYVDNLQVESWL